MESNILTIAAFVPALAKLDEGKGNNSEEFECFKVSNESTPEAWWDSLKWIDKVNVGSVALHYNKMSARYPWKCQDNEKFSDLTKGQQKIVKFVFSTRDRKYSHFPLETLLRVK